MKTTLQETNYMPHILTIWQDYLHPEVEKNIHYTISWVIQILEETWNESNEDIWKIHWGKVGGNWFELNWENFDGLDEIFKFNNAILAIVYNNKDIKHWIVETKKANKWKDPSEFVDKTFIKKQKVREFIDLTSWKKLNKMIELLDYFKTNSLDNEEYERNFIRFKNIISK